MDSTQINNSNTLEALDCISRQAAIDALNEQIEQCNKALGSFDISLKDEFAIKVERASLKAYREQLENLPTIQLGTNLAEVGTDLAFAQPERVWSELDKQLIDTLLRKIYELQGTSLSMDGVVAKKYYIEELYGVLFGRGEKPRWMI